MASFERAWRDGADVVELDVRLSADHQVIVMHDASLERTTDGTGYVSERTLAELKLLDAGSWFSSAFAGERIPALEEVLIWAKGRIGLLLELKYEPFGAFDPALVPQVVALVAKTDIADQVGAISYQPRALVQLKALSPNTPAGPLLPRDGLLRLVVWLQHRFRGIVRAAGFRRILERPLRLTRGWGCDIVAPNIEVVTKVLVDAAHAVRLPVSSGGLHWDYPAAIRIGVDTVSANDPGLVRSLYL